MQDTPWRQAVPSRARLIAYLLYVMQGMTYHQISMLVGIGMAMVCLCVHQCTYAICKHTFLAYIHLPTPAEVRRNMQLWQQQCSIPGIFGAIDGTHISITQPCENGQDYFNRKSFYSVNVQGSNLF